MPLWSLSASIEAMPANAVRGGGAAALMTGLVAAGAVLGVASGTASSHSVSQKTAVVAVTAGKPTEWSFTLSTRSAPLGTVVFKVTNRGTRPHQFKVCSTPAASARRLACAGTATPVLEPGRSATLTVSFSRAGTYEYLCTSGAARGMKGLFALVAAPMPGGGASTTSPTGGSAAPAPTTPGVSGGDPAAGLAVFNAYGCSSCHTMDEIKGSGGVTASFNSVHPLPFDKGPLTGSQIADLAAYIASR
jgi:plastocyanin